MINITQRIFEAIIRKFETHLSNEHWAWICCNIKLSESFLIEFKDSINFYHISRHQVLSENFIRRFDTQLNWFWITNKQKLSEGFIREFQNSVNWTWIGSCQVLSEEFIYEFDEYLIDNFYDICQYQKLNIDFIVNNLDKIIIPAILENKKIKLPKDLKEQLILIHKMSEL
jgi:hypothetical protein